MKANLNAIKERLEKEGIVNKVELYEHNNELAINEEYFTYDDKTGDSDLYYIGITIDENGKYDMETHFCEEDFLDNYNNQEEYIRGVVDSMNLDIDNQNNNIISNAREILNSQALGEYMIKNILNKQAIDADTPLFWVAEDLSCNDNNIHKIYPEETIVKIFEEFFYNNTEEAFEYIKYLSGTIMSYNEDINQIIFDIVMAQTKEVSKTCYWNNYLSKFMPRDMMMEALYELSSSNSFSKVQIRKDYGEYIEVVLKNGQVARVLSENHDYADSWYTVYINRIATISNISNIDELANVLIELGSF